LTCDMYLTTGRDFTMRRVEIKMYFDMLSNWIRKYFDIYLTPGRDFTRMCVEPKCILTCPN
jgi:hypothetical protein